MIAALFAAAFFSIILHEVAHGYAALLLGDDTAKRYGRLSLNPLRHVDAFGTVLLPLTLMWLGSPFLFGWAKPVPVNFARLRHRRRDTMIVASAGIAVNFALFLLGYALFATRALPPAGVLFVVYFMMMNIALILFNILPIPPLDGSKIFFGGTDNPRLQKYVAAEKQGLAFLLIIAVLLPAIGQVFGQHWDILHAYFAAALKLFYALIGG